MQFLIHIKAFEVQQTSHMRTRTCCQSSNGEINSFRGGKPLTYSRSATSGAARTGTTQNACVCEEQSPGTSDLTVFCEMQRSGYCSLCFAATYCCCMKEVSAGREFGSVRFECWYDCTGRVSFQKTAADRRKRNKVGVDIVAEILLLIRNLAISFVLNQGFYFIGKCCYMIPFILLCLGGFQGTQFCETSVLMSLTWKCKGMYTGEKVCLFCVDIKLWL